jgi:murein DD-endopeptidase MepM/ murein hydrolase activator NlpD
MGPFLWLCALTLLGQDPPPPPAPPSAAQPPGPPAPGPETTDLDLLVFPAPQHAATRRPEVDIRRYLRPDASIIDARTALDRSLHATTTRRAELETLLERVAADVARREAAFAQVTEDLVPLRADVTEKLLLLQYTRKLGSLTSVLGRKPRLDWGGIMRQAGFVDWVELEVMARVATWTLLHLTWRAFDADLERRRRNQRHLERTIAVLGQEATWDREEQDALKRAVTGEAEFFAAYGRDMEKVDEELKLFIRDKLVAVGARPRLFMADNRGRVMSPVRNGEVVGHYGARTWLGVKVPARGVAMTAPAEPWRKTDPRTVRAIYWGYVLWTGWFRGLGQVVLLDHTQGYVSVYAHLAEIHVEVAQKVPTGTSLGLIGETDSFFGPRLHFELRLEGQAQNPMPWFQ